MYCTRKFLLQNKLSHSKLVRFQVFRKPEVLLTIGRISPLAIIVAYDLLVCLVDLPHFGIYQPTNQMVGNRLIELPPSPPLPPLPPRDVFQPQPVLYSYTVYIFLSIIIRMLCTVRIFSCSFPCNAKETAAWGGAVEAHFRVQRLLRKNWTLAFLCQIVLESQFQNVTFSCYFLLWLRISKKV